MDASKVGLVQPPFFLLVVAYELWVDIKLSKHGGYCKWLAKF